MEAKNLPAAPEVNLETQPANQPGEGGSIPTLALPGPLPAYPLFGQAQQSDATQPGAPLAATGLRIEEIPMRFAQELNRRWHSLLPRTDLGNLFAGTTSVAYGALGGSHWYAVAIWTQPIIASCCDGQTIELRRLAICDAAPKNTASRMLAVCRRLVRRKFPQITRAISYLAVDVHAGTIYRADGWKPDGEIVAARPQRFTFVNKNTRATAPLQTRSRKQRWSRSL